MPRVTSLVDPAADLAAQLPLLPRRIRRAHQVLDDRPIEDPDAAKRPVPARPARYLLLQEYADQGRDCGQAFAYGPDALGLLADAQDEISDGWVPVEVHDLDTGTAWGVDLLPVLCGPRRPVDAVDQATAEVASIAQACGYDPYEECGIDALIDFKDAIEARLHCAIAAGWSQ